jgi:predicted TIM-barrel fold metal-dependent hydrolase
VNFALAPEEVLDGQVHIWADASASNPWRREWYARAHRFPALGGDELLGIMDEAGVGRAVLVQPSWAGDSNHVVLEAARQHPERFAVMARVPPDRATGSPLLASLAGCPEVAGVRLTFHRPEMQAWLVDGTTDWLWPALVEHRLAAMVYAPYRNAELRAIAERHPGLRLAIDALGLTLTMRDREIDGPIRNLAQLADLPNVSLKATALPGYVSEPYPYPSLAPRLRWLVDTFGPNRVFWASDLTRVDQAYRAIVTFAAELGVLTDDELAAFMGRGLAAWLSTARVKPCDDVGRLRTRPENERENS